MPSSCFIPSYPFPPSLRTPMSSGHGTPGSHDGDGDDIFALGPTSGMTSAQKKAYRAQHAAALKRLAKEASQRTMMEMGNSYVNELVTHGISLFRASSDRGSLHNWVWKWIQATSKAPIPDWDVPDDLTRDVVKGILLIHPAVLHRSTNHQFSPRVGGPRVGGLKRSRAVESGGEVATGAGVAGGIGALSAPSPTPSVAAAPGAGATSSTAGALTSAISPSSGTPIVPLPTTTLSSLKPKLAGKRSLPSGAADDVSLRHAFHHFASRFPHNRVMVSGMTAGGVALVGVPRSLRLSGEDSGGVGGAPPFSSKTALMMASLLDIHSPTFGLSGLVLGLGSTSGAPTKGLPLITTSSSGIAAGGGSTTTSADPASATTITAPTPAASTTVPPATTTSTVSNVGGGKKQGKGKGGGGGGGSAMTLRNRGEMDELRIFPWTLDDYYSPHSSVAFFRSTFYSAAGAGLINGGNWCFVLCTLQVLMKLPCFVYFLYAHKGECSKDLPPPLTRGSHPCFLCLLYDLAEKCHTKPIDDGSPVSPQDASKIIRALRCLGAVDEYNPHSLAQDCVAPFLDHLAGISGGFFRCTALRSTYLGLPREVGPKGESRAMTVLGYGSVYKAGDLPISSLSPPSLLLSRTTTLVVCDCDSGRPRCNGISEAVTFFPLTLNHRVPNAAPTPFSEIMNAKFGPSSAEVCPSCKQPMKDSTAIEVPAHVLPFFFNRSYGINDKVTTEVAVPETFEFGKYLYLSPSQIEAGKAAGGVECLSSWNTTSFELRGKLVGLQCHTGVSGDMGHYIAIARELPNAMTYGPLGVQNKFTRRPTDVFHVYDDKVVTKIDLETVLAAPSPSSPDRASMSKYERNCLQPAVAWYELDNPTLVASLQTSARRIPPPPSTKNLSPHFKLDPDKLAKLETIMAAGAPFKAKDDATSRSQRTGGVNTTNIPTHGVFDPKTGAVSGCIGDSDDTENKDVENPPHLCAIQTVDLDTGSVSFNSRDAADFQPGQWVNEFSMDMFFAVLRKHGEAAMDVFLGDGEVGSRHSIVWGLSPTFSSTLMGEYARGTGAFDGPTVIRLLQQCGHSRHFFKYGWIVLPLNHNYAHWGLIVISHLHRNLYYLDPLRLNDDGSESGSSLARKKQVLERVSEFLVYAWPILTDDSVAFPKYKLANVPVYLNPTSVNPGLPQQDNGNDCGVFTCVYALSLALGLGIPKTTYFTAKDTPYFRKRIAMICFTAELK